MTNDGGVTCCRDGDINPDMTGLELVWANQIQLKQTKTTTEFQLHAVDWVQFPFHRSDEGEV